MNCKDVEKRLPDYLAGTCAEAEKEMIAGHLEKCRRCSGLARQMEEPVGKAELEDGDTTAPVKKVLRRTSRKFTLRVAGTCFAALALLALAWFVSLLIGGGLGFAHLKKSQRALYDLVQFSQPDRVVAYGNGPINGLLQVPISVYVRPYTGLNPQEQREYMARMSAFTGKFESPAGFGSGFLHPAVADSDDDTILPEPLTTLERSGENTVATVNLSFNDTKTVEEVTAMTGPYDVKLLWMAVEAGVETVIPRNMSLSGQALQWGLPGTFSQFQGDEIELAPGNVQDYLAAVLDELEWLDRNRKRIKPARSLLKSNGLDNSVGEKAAYILEHGIHIYGLQVTGPSGELVRLIEDIPVREVVIVDVDFWYW